MTHASIAPPAGQLVAADRGDWDIPPDELSPSEQEIDEDVTEHEHEHEHVHEHEPTVPAPERGD